jgi:hypothetical protein
MIALVLASQLLGVAPANPNAQAFFTPVAPRSSGLIKTLPRNVACKNDLSRMEVSFAQPAALYRHGDRPAKGLKNWVDYPDGALCLVGDAK